MRLQKTTKFRDFYDMGSNTACGRKDCRRSSSEDLLVAQALHRVQLRGAGGGDGTEKNSYHR